MHALNPFLLPSELRQLSVALYSLNPAIIKAKSSQYFYMQHTTYTYTESKDIWVLTNFTDTNVNCQGTKTAKL